MKSFSGFERAKHMQVTTSLRNQCILFTKSRNFNTKFSKKFCFYFEKCLNMNESFFRLMMNENRSGRESFAKM